MARTDREYKIAYNKLLERLSYGGNFTSVSDLARMIDVSRTTARKVIIKCQQEGIFELESERYPTLLRSPVESDYFDFREVCEPEKLVEYSLLRWMVDVGLRPGMKIDNEIAVRLDLPLAAFRDWIAQVEKYGLVEKIASGQWRYLGLSERMSAEIIDTRVFMETRATRRLMNLPKSAHFWPAVSRLRKIHEDVKLNGPTSLTDFVELDYRFHSLLYDSADLPLLKHLRVLFCFLMFKIFSAENPSHFSERWIGEAVDEHLEIIDAMQKRKTLLATRLVDDHLAKISTVLLVMAPELD